MSVDLREIEQKVLEIKRVVLELENMLSKLHGGVPSPPKWCIPRIFIWYEIYSRGGVVDRSELHQICKMYYGSLKALGGFFTGKDSSLQYVGVNKDKVALKDWAIKEVEQYIEWIKKNRDSYKR